MTGPSDGDLAYTIAEIPKGMTGVFTKRKGEIFSILILFLTIIVLSSTFSGIASAETCDPISGWDFCIDNVDVSSTSVTTGDEVTVDVSVENVGEKLGTVRVALIVEKPDGSTEKINYKKIYDIGVGETGSTELSYTPPSDAEPGEYEARIVVRSAPGEHDFDARSQDFSVQTVGSVKVKVRDPEGDPLVSRVYLTADSVRSTLTNDNGVHTFTDVPPGSHTVEAVLSGYETEETTVDVTSGTVEKTLVLEPEEFDVDLSSEPISADIDGDGTYSYGDEVEISAPEEVGDYEFEAWEYPDGEEFVDENRYTIDYLTADRELIAQYKKVGKPDLVIDDISWTPDDPLEGETVTFEVDVENIGESRAASTDLRLSVGNDIIYRDDFDVSPGEEKEIEFDSDPAKWEAEKDATTVSAKIDYEDQIDEEDEFNNEYEESINVEEREPDLEVSEVEVTPSNPKRGDETNFDVTVQNTGDGDAHDFAVELEVGGESFSESGINLDAGESKTLTLGSWSAETDIEQVTAVADQEDSVDESDESNNEESISLSVSNPKPDLTVTDIQLDPSNPTAGETTLFRAKVKNTGDEIAEDIGLTFLVDGEAATTPPTFTLGPGEKGSTAWTHSHEFSAGEHDVSAASISVIEILFLV